VNDFHYILHDYWRELSSRLSSALTAETTSEGKILGLNSDTPGVDGSQVGVLEEGDEVGLSSLLKGHNSRGLEPKIRLEVLSDFPDEPLEGELPDQQLGGLLVLSDFTEGDSSGAEAMRLLDASCRRRSCGLPSLLGGELLARSLASSRFASSLLSASHWIESGRCVENGSSKVFDEGGGGR